MAELSENLNEWPSSPHDVLGVHSNSTPKEIRRAYFRLIRRFTPDDFPQHFQRIRECFDQLQDRGHAPSDSFPINLNRPDTSANDSDLGDSADLAFSPNAPGDHDERTDGEPDELREVWERIESKDWPDARRHIRAILERQSGASPEPSRFLLYALSNLGDMANLPSERFDILLNLLDDCAHPYQVARWLEFEALRNPHLIETPDFQEFLGKCDHSDTLDTLYRLRWRILGLGRYETIIADVELLQNRALELGEDRLLGLLQESVEYTVWCDSPLAQRHFNECLPLVSNPVGGSELGFQYADIMEYIHEAADDWTQLCTFKKSPLTHFVSQVIPYCRTDSIEQMKARWKAGTAFLPSSPLDLLQPLETLFVRFPLAMHLFFQGLCELTEARSHEFEFIDADEAEQLVTSFLRLRGGATYDEMRKDALQVCFENTMPLPYFARIADELVFDVSTVVENWSSVVNRDLPLQSALYLALA